MLHSAAPPPTRSRPRRPGSRALRPAVLGELALGLLLGAVAGWLAGLLRVPRAQDRHA